MATRAEINSQQAILTEKRDTLNSQIAVLQAKINTATAAGDTNTATSLILSQNELNHELIEVRSQKRVLNSQIASDEAGFNATPPVTPAPTPAPSTNVDPAAPAAESSTTTTGSAPANTTNSNTGENASNDDRKSTVAPATKTSTTPPSDFIAVIGGRTSNPLTYFSSFTYHLTLYMVTPEAYTRFINEGADQITNEGFYVVAESAGTAPNSVTPRLFPDRDYFIDDLQFKTFVNPKTNDGPITSMGFEFKIYEPYGFSFTSQLKAAAAKIDAHSKLPNANQNFNPLKHFFVLGFKFFGYDSAGEYTVFDQLAAERGKNVNTDPQLKVGGVFPRYFPLNITDFSFKLDGKTTVYSIKMGPVALQEAFGVKRSQVQSTYELVGTTVNDVLLGKTASSNQGNNSINGLLDILNKKEADLKSAGKAAIANIYEINIDPEIGDTKLITDNKFKAAMKGVSSSDGVSAKESTNNTKYDPTTRTITVNSGQSLIKLIDNVICQSKYVTIGMETIYNEELTTQSTTQTPKEVQWFMINPQAFPLGYDPIRNDYSYRLVYNIAPYKIPFFQSSFVKVDKRTGYYGAHKKYDYYFTGKNTNVLSFETTYNNLYFIPGGSDSAAEPNGSNATVPVAPDVKIIGNESQIGKAGDPVGSIKTSIYSLADQVKAKIQITGDPDFLMTKIGTSGNATAPKEAVYGSDYTVNPFGGQVFIEINFYEGVDYDTQTGLFIVNKDIEFYQYPKKLKESANIQGVIYMVMSVTSFFSKGKFTQELDLVLWPAPPDEETKTVAGRELSTNDQTKRNVISAGVKDGAFLADVPKAQNVGFAATPPLSTFGTTALATTNIDILKTIAPTTADKTNSSILAAINRVQQEGGREPPQVG